MNDFEEFNVTPELTLDPFQEEKKETPQIYQETEPETPDTGRKEYGQCICRKN